MNPQDHSLTSSAAPERVTMLRIGDVAERTGLTQRTIRYYEELGLLAPATRTHGDYRVFTEEDVQRLEEIRDLREVLGFSLSEIRRILLAQRALEKLRASYQGTEHLGERLERLEEALKVTEEQIALVDSRLGEIQRMKSELCGRADRYRARRRELEKLIEMQGGAASE